MYALLNSDQTDLAATAGQVAERIGLANPADLETIDRAAGWGRLRDVGFCGLRQRDDGTPLASGVEVAVVAEALGRRLVPQPFIASAVAAVELLARGGADDALIDAATNAEPHAVALAADLSGWASAGSPGALAWGPSEAAWLLSVEPDGDNARLVRSRVSGGDNVAVDLTQSLWPLEDVSDGDDVGTLSAQDLDSALALTLAAICADTVGLMRQALDGAVDYSKDRIAYGVPTGSFQAIQHISAESLVMIEAASGAAYYAAWCVDELDAGTALLAARTAKAHAAEVGRTVTENVMQIYGGIGQTWEHIAHFFTRRALVNTQLFGAQEAQLAQIADARLKGQ